MHVLTLGCQCRLTLVVREVHNHRHELQTREDIILRLVEEMADLDRDCRAIMGMMMKEVRHKIFMEHLSANINQSNIQYRNTYRKWHKLFTSKFTHFRTFRKILLNARRYFRHASARSYLSIAINEINSEIL